MVRIGPGSMYSQAYVSTGGSSASIAPCDRVDWKLKFGKQGGGRALFSISERLPALTAPCKEELCGCVLWGWGAPMCRLQGETLQEVEGSKRLQIAQQMPLPLTISCCSKSRLVLICLVLPFWYLLTQMVPDIFQKSSKTVVCYIFKSHIKLF